MYRLYIPNTLDIEFFLKKDGKLKKRRKHIQRYQYVISFIIYTQHTLKFKEKTNPYVPICQSIIRKIIGQRLVMEIFSDLQKWGVIEKDGMAQKGSKCTGYKLTTKYAKLEYKEDFVRDNQMWNNIKRHTVTNNRIIVGNSKYMKFLFQCLSRLEINYPKANNDIKANFANNSKKKNSRLLSIGLIHEKDWFFKRDLKGKRLHTNLSSFPKDLRRFLRVRDLKTNNYLQLVELDIRNSQPLFMLIYLLKYYKKHVSSEELKKLQLIVENGFYQFFMQKLEINDRSLVKKGVYGKLLFNRTKAFKLTPYEAIFKNEFPSIFNVLLKLKNQKHGLVAHKMQEVEARFIIDTICKDYSQAYPHGFIGTIHDSVILPMQHANKVKAHMERKIRSLYGIKMTLHVKTL